MIKKLRKRFIMVTSFALLGVIGILIISINAINLYNNKSNLNNMMNFVFSNDGRILINRPDIDNDMLHKNDNMNKKNFFNTRFCVVNLDDNKEVQNIYSDRVVMFTENEIKDYIKYILEAKESEGWIDDYKYKIGSVEGGYRIVIIDASAIKEANWSIFNISMSVGIISYLVVLLIVTLCSKRAIAPMLEGYEKQKQFITDASHELKTPLTIISANSEILEMTYGSDEWIEGIENQVEIMRDLVNNMVILSRMDEEKQEIIFKEFNISDAIYDTAMAFQGLCKNDNKELNLDIDVDIYVNGDESSLRQLISILLDNAVKYCDKDGVINVELKKEKQVVLTVTNSYDNVKNIELDRLFDRFYRVDKSRTKKGSYGLGLAIAQAIVNVHKGKIKVTNIKNEFIQFKIIL